jgi:hypothetical protein
MADLGSRGAYGIHADLAHRYTPLSLRFLHLCFELSLQSLTMDCIATNGSRLEFRRGSHHEIVLSVKTLDGGIKSGVLLLKATMVERLNEFLFCQRHV